MIERAHRIEPLAEGGPEQTAAISPLAARSLRTQKVMIGPILPEDTAALFLWLNDAESAALDLPYRPVDWMHYNSWLENIGKSPAHVMFAVRTVFEPRIIGFVALTKIDPVHRSAELGVRIGAEADRGKGYGKDVIRLAVDYAWRHLNLNRIHLNVFDFNHRAIGAYRAAGFQHEGTLRQAAFINGAWTDVVVMGALRG